MFQDLVQTIEIVRRSFMQLGVIVFLAFTMVFLLGCFATVMIGQADAHYNPYFQESHGLFDHEYWFGSVSRSMATFIQIATFDDWSEDIARHVGRTLPGSQFVFVLFIMVMSFGVLNVVVSAVIDSTITLGKENG